MTNARTRTQEITQVKNPVATDAIAAVQTNNNAFRSALKAGFRRMAKAGVAATAVFTVTMAALGVSPAAAQTSDQGLPYAPIALSKPVADVGQGVQVDYTSFGNLGAPAQGSKLSVLDANGSNALYNGEASVIAQSSGPIGQNPEVGVVEFNRPGTYSVQNLLMTGSGEIGSNVAKITVNPDPQVNIQVSGLPLIAGQSATFTPTVMAGTGTGPFSFGFQVVQNTPNGGTVWDGSFSPSAGNTSMQVPFPTAGSFNVIMTMTDGTGYQSSVGTTTLTVNSPVSAPTISAQSTTTIGQGSAVLFNYGSSNGTGCTYSFGVTDPNGKNALTTMVNNDSGYGTTVPEVQIGTGSTGKFSVDTALYAVTGTYTVTVTANCGYGSASTTTTFTLGQFAPVNSAPDVCPATSSVTTGTNDSNFRIYSITYDPNRNIDVSISGMGEWTQGQTVDVFLTAGSLIAKCTGTVDASGNVNVSITPSDVNYQTLKQYGASTGVDLSWYNEQLGTSNDQGIAHFS